MDILAGCLHWNGFKISQVNLVEGLDAFWISQMYRGGGVFVISQLGLGLGGYCKISQMDLLGSL